MESPRAWDGSGFELLSCADLRLCVFLCFLEEGEFHRSSVSSSESWSLSICSAALRVAMVRERLSAVQREGEHKQNGADLE